MPAPTRVLRASWSSTLALPRSTFPPRPIVADRPKYLKQCTDDLYQWQRNAPEFAKKKPFVLHDGPPYANGDLHIGHALNKILKDIILRVQLAQGRSIEYVPGWDCHGLPIELKALQLHAEKSGKSLKQEDGQGKNAVEIRKLAKSLALRTVDEQRESFRRWAVIGDWERPYRTLDEDFELRQLEVFRQMLSKGLIYRRFKPVYWSPSTGTALAEAELEYKEDHMSHSAFVSYQLVREDEVAEKFGLQLADGAGIPRVSVLIWTTTPWTLPANRAIAVHEDLDYVCAHFEGIGYVIVEQSRLDEVENICGVVHNGPILGPIKGSELTGQAYWNDTFAENDSHEASVTGQILDADFVSADSGTGLVHCAPGHGMDDYHLCLKHGIEPFAPVDDAGAFTSDVYTKFDEALLVGKIATSEGNKAVLEYLRNHPVRNRLLGIQKYKHKYPYDWRSKQPVIVRATAQWFADVGEIRADTLREIENIRFIPDTGKERLKSFVKNRTEWCISRQRAWGVPIPALYCKDTGEALLTPDSVAHIMSVIEERGIDAWWTDASYDQAWIPPDSRDGTLYERGKDTMDVWFDSGTSWTHMGKTAQGFESRTSDVYLEGSDQHRGWFQSSILTKIAHDTAKGVQPKSPFSTLITHGFTLDGKGKKMSKSVGNTISPVEIMEGTLLPPVKRKGKKQTTDASSTKYDALGPDALRFWVAGSDYTKDVNIGQDVLKGVNGDLNKLRVTFKLLTGLLEDFSPAAYHRRLNQLEPVDIAAFLHLSSLSRSVWDAFADHEHHKAVLFINQYINAQFSAFYMEAVKDRMYTEAKDGARRRDAQFVLWNIFEELCSILRPIVPLLVEEARAHMPSLGQTTNKLVPWRTLDSDDLKTTDPLILDLRDPQGSEDRLRLVQETLPVLLQLRAEVHAMSEQERAKKNMGSGLQSYVVLQLLSDDQGSPAHKQLKKILSVWGQSPFLEDLFVVSKVDVDFDGTLIERRIQGTDSTKAVSWYRLGGIESSGFKLFVHEPIAHKCERCWKYTVEDDKHSVCARCESVVGRNEPREVS